MKRKKIIWTIILTLLVVIAGAGYYAYKEYNRKNKDLKHEKADFSLAATDLINEFAANDTASNAKYLGKVVEVSGLIKDIVKDEKGYYTIVIGDTTSMSSVRCSMDSAHNADAGLVSKGNPVSMKGICTGYMSDALLGSDVILNRAVLKKLSIKH